MADDQEPILIRQTGASLSAPNRTTKKKKKKSRGRLSFASRLKCSAIIRALARSTARLRRTTEPSCRLPHGFAKLLESSSTCTYKPKPRVSYLNCSLIPFQLRRRNGHVPSPHHINDPLLGNLAHSPHTNDGAPNRFDTSRRITRGYPGLEPRPTKCLEHLWGLGPSPSNPSKKLKAPMGHGDTKLRHTKSHVSATKSRIEGTFRGLWGGGPSPLSALSIGGTRLLHPRLQVASCNMEPPRKPKKHEADDHLQIKHQIQSSQTHMNGDLASTGPHKGGIPHDVPKGCVGLYVGEDHTRFVVPVPFLNHPLFASLLEGTAEVDGAFQPGALWIPCKVAEFQTLQYHVKQLGKHSL